MPSINFIDQQTVVPASWLNFINSFFFTLFNGATTAAQAQTALGVPSTTGTGASGSWGISVTGSAATATSAAIATNLAGGINGQSPVQSAAGVTYMGIPILRGFIDGCIMSTAGSSATMSIAAGVCADSTNLFMLSLSAISKTTSAWSVGSAAGGLDTGAIATTTWYYFYAIRRPDTGVVDVVFSTSSSAPTLPTNYTQYRYIGAGLTNGSSQWVLFKQTGDEFYWSTPILDINTTGSATATLVAMSVPRGRKMKLFGNLQSVSDVVYVSDPDGTDLAPSGSVSPLSTQLISGGTLTIVAQITVWTNTSAQIRHREATNNAVLLATLGWRDTRGRDA